MWNRFTWVSFVVCQLQLIRGLGSGRAFSQSPRLFPWQTVIHQQFIVSIKLPTVYTQKTASYIFDYLFNFSGAACNFRVDFSSAKHHYKPLSYINNAFFFSLLLLILIRETNTKFFGEWRTEVPSISVFETKPNIPEHGTRR